MLARTEPTVGVSILHALPSIVILTGRPCLRFHKQHVDREGMRVDPPVMFAVNEGTSNDVRIWTKWLHLCEGHTTRPQQGGRAMNCGSSLSVKKVLLEQSRAGVLLRYLIVGRAPLGLSEGYDKADPTVWFIFLCLTLTTLWPLLISPPIE